MNINKFPNGGGTSFPPMDAGTYPAVCSGVIDIGTHTEQWDGKSLTKNQLILLFDFPTETIEINGEEKPRCLSLKLTKSTHEHAKLRCHLIAWRGRDFTEEELKDFEMNRLLGVPATVTVTQKTRQNGKTYTSISSIGKAMKGITMPKDCRKLYFDLDDTSTYRTIEDLPDWMISEINQSAEAIAKQWVFAKGSAVDTSDYVDTNDDSDNGDVPF